MSVEWPLAFLLHRFTFAPLSSTLGTLIGFRIGINELDASDFKSAPQLIQGRNLAVRAEQLEAFDRDSGDASLQDQLLRLLRHGFPPQHSSKRVRYVGSGVIDFRR